MEYDTKGKIHYLYLNTIGLHVCRTDKDRFHYRGSNFLFYTICSFFKPHREHWRIVKLYALHNHRPRSPTVERI